MAAPAEAYALRIAVFRDGELTGVHVLPGPRVTAGRDRQCELPLDCDRVSRKHVIIEHDGERVHVRDAGSANCTLVNDTPIARATEVGAEDEIRVGLLMLKVQLVPRDRQGERPQPAAADDFSAHGAAASDRDALPSPEPLLPARAEPPDAPPCAIGDEVTDVRRGWQASPPKIVEAAVSAASLRTVGEDFDERTDASLPTVIEVEVMRRGELVGSHALRKVGITLGRDEHCDVVLASERVSRRHASITCIGGRLYARDLDSSNGILVNDKLVDEAELGPHDDLTIVDLTVRARLVERRPEGEVGSGKGRSMSALSATPRADGRSDGEGDTGADGELEPEAIVEVSIYADAGPRGGPLRTERHRKAQLIIGRDPGADIVLASTLVSRLHAIIEHDGLTLRVRDAGSANGIRVNGERTEMTRLSPIDDLQVGEFRLRLRLTTPNPTRPENSRASADNGSVG